jgi:PhnB protein
MSHQNDTAIKGFELTVRRVVNAPCALVYRAWTDPEKLAQWFSPAEVELRSFTGDIKIGGTFRVHYVSAKGEYIAQGQYREIVPHRRLKFSWTWDHYAMPESVVTVEFEDLGQTTRVTLRHEGLPDQEDASEHTHGWTSLMAERFAPYIEANIIKPTKPTTTMNKNTSVQAYLNFDGRCEEAIEFYRSALGAEVVMLMRFKDSPEPPPPGCGLPGTENKVMHAEIRVGQTTLMLADGHCAGKTSFAGISLCLTVETEPDADRLFNALAGGGEVQRPLGKTFYSPRFGMVTDRFGLLWMVYTKM